MPAPQKLPRGACDAFSQHLQAIGRIPLLTPDEEITLARQVQCGLRLREAAQEMTLRAGGHPPSLQAWAAEVRLTPQALQRQLRHAERALTHGAVVWLDNDQPNSVLSFLRREPGAEVLCVVNLADCATEVRIKFPEPTPWSCSTLLAGGAKADTNDSDLLLDLEGLGYFVGKRK